MKKVLFLSVFILTVLYASFAKAGITDCASGYHFNPRSGVGCQQTNCGDIQHAHYSYEGYCICGSSGSINENPNDPNKACSYDNSHISCPGCVYACVHTNEECPRAPGAAQTEPEPASPPAVTEILPETAPPGLQTQPPAAPELALHEAQAPGVMPVPLSEPGAVAAPDGHNRAAAPVPAQAQANAPSPPPGRTCAQECAKLKRGAESSEVVKAEGVYPNCTCIVDNRDNLNRLTQTVTLDGDARTTFTYDPATGELIRRETISMNAERERIREQLGFKYDEDRIDQLLEDQKINTWFQEQIKNIETNPHWYSLTFWWQHIVAILDHGYGNSADFVDTYHYGRCGDSMEWMERNISAELQLNGPNDKNSEAVLSITGESYWNILNHTSLIVRPSGFSNIEWGDIVQELTDKTRAGGLTEADIQGLDPRILDAKVLDPYKKQSTTVREFIKGWSVIKIS